MSDNYMYFVVRTRCTDHLLSRPPKIPANKGKIPPASMERTWTVLRWFVRVSEAAGSRRMMITGITECHREVSVVVICVVTDHI